MYIYILLYYLWYINNIIMVITCLNYSLLCMSRIISYSFCCASLLGLYDCGIHTVYTARTTTIAAQYIRRPRRPTPGFIRVNSAHDKLSLAI